ncbi:hypothetical protein BYT27DRAFT_6487120 [Phlegmacium glaucopus]|nr:hypothetical protein BYT27DRAFT_6487120 [Phlegmacium glaucopus]
MKVTRAAKKCKAASDAGPKTIFTCPFHSHLQDDGALHMRRKIEYKRPTACMMACFYTCMFSPIHFLLFTLHYHIPSRKRPSKDVRAEITLHRGIFRSPPSSLTPRNI